MRFEDSNILLKERLEQRYGSGSAQSILEEIAYAEKHHMFSNDNISSFDAKGKS